MRHAKIDDPLAYQLLQTIPGVGKILALVMHYELHDARQFIDRTTSRICLFVEGRWLTADEWLKGAPLAARSR